MAEPLRFERVAIRSMPGFEDGGFTLDRLSPGVNVVHGPNASGKTTAARALELLLWPRAGAAAHARVAGRVRLSDAEWAIELDGSRVVYQRDGIRAEPPALPPAEERDRYRLSLHELLKADDSHFAEAIVRETAGGYDLAALAPGGGAGQGQLKHQRELQQAKETWERAVAAQRALEEQERRLAGLRAREADARRAAVRLGVLERALEHVRARADHAVAEAEVSRFAPALVNVRGSEHESVAKIDARLEEIAVGIRAAEADRARALETVASTALPEALGADVVEGLRADLERVRELERDLSAAAQLRASARAKRGEERARIGGAISDAQLAALDHVAMGEVLDFADRARAARADLGATEAELRRVAAPADGGAPEDPATLAHAVRALHAWLRVPDGDAGASTHRRNALRAAGALLAAGLALALATPWALIAAVAGAALLVHTVAQKPDSVDAREVHRQTYRKLGIDEPEAWTPEAVERLADALLERRAEAAAAEARERERKRLQDRLEALSARMAALDIERARLADSLGVAPELDEQHLSWIAARISGWQTAQAELTRADAAHAETAAELDRLVSDLGARLAEYGFTGLRSTGQITGAIAEVEKRRERRDGAARDAAEAEQRIRRLTEERTRCLEERRAVFTAVGLDDGAVETLRSLCASVPEYRRAIDALRRAESDLAGARRRLEEVGADPALLSAPEPQLLQSLEEARDAAGQLEAVRDEITEIETRVRDAKETHDIAAALERMERCRDALREVRERETRAAAARVLLDYLQQETRDQHRPAVFHHAREIFSRITHGRYELRFRPDAGGAFVAYDTEAGVGRELDELSSGTRVQLLLAVRVAFVETQEREARLPLVLDELLGNSDDERALAIMDAVVELARTGRQVFYLTAQADEVQKWRSVLARHTEIASRVIDLAETRRMNRALRIPDLHLAPPGPRVPDPAGSDHAGYGRRLGVPSIDRVSATAGALHLWYLVEDPVELHRVLSLGPRSWGALEGLVRNGGRRLVGDALLARTDALARAAQTFLEESRVGVGRPVDRAALESADAISDTFLERFDSVCRMLEGDARRLVEELEARQLKELRGFRNDKAEQLRAYLEEHGYLDPRAPLGDDEIRSRVVGSVAAEIESGVVSVEELDRMMARLRLGLG